MAGLELRYQRLRALVSRVQKAAALLSHIGRQDALVDQLELERSDISLNLLHLLRDLWLRGHNFLRYDLRLRLDRDGRLAVLRHLRVNVEEGIVALKEAVLLP